MIVGTAGSCHGIGQVAKLLKSLASSKLTWQWNIPILNREYIFNWSIFRCHVSLPEGRFGGMVCGLVGWFLVWLVDLVAGLPPSDARASQNTMIAFVGMVI